MAKQPEILPTNPKRVEAFAKFFKNYMSLSSVIVAALPIPITSMHLIPTYAAQTGILSTYTSLFCFLLLGWIFYSRHRLARAMFRDTALSIVKPRVRIPRIPWISLLPGLLIVLSAFSALQYHRYLDRAVQGNRYLQGHIAFAPAEPQTPREVPAEDDVLKKVSLSDIPFSENLMAYYIGIFIFAEGAFILMALREYLQDLLGLSEAELISGWPLPPS